MSLSSVDPNNSHHLFIVAWHLSSRTARRTRTFRPVTSCLDCCWRACRRPAGVSRRPAAQWRTCVPAGDIVDAAVALRRSTGWGCGSCGSGGVYTSPSSSSPPLYLRENQIGLVIVRLQTSRSSVRPGGLSRPKSSRTRPLSLSRLATLSRLLSYTNYVKISYYQLLKISFIFAFFIKKVKIESKHKLVTVYAQNI